MIGARYYQQCLAIVSTPEVCVCSRWQPWLSVALDVCHNKAKPLCPVPTGASSRYGTLLNSWASRTTSTAREPI